MIGTIGALAAVGAAFALPQGSFSSTLLHILGNVGLFINLFNLIPARPLDGGRILHPLGDGVVYCGFAILLALALATGDLFFVVIALFSVGNMPVRPWVVYMLWGFLFTASATMLLPSMQYILYGTFFYVFIVLAAGMFVLAWKTRAKPLPAPEEEDEHEIVPVFIKIKWLTYYVVLLLVIVGAMSWHSKHLPKEISQSPLVQFVHKL